MRADDSIGAARQGWGRYLTFYNQTRPHRALDGKTPDQVYDDNLLARLTAAEAAHARRHLRIRTFCPTNRGHLCASRLPRM